MQSLVYTCQSIRSCGSPLVGGSLFRANSEFVFESSHEIIFGRVDYLSKEMME